MPRFVADVVVIIIIIIIIIIVALFPSSSATYGFSRRRKRQQSSSFSRMRSTSARWLVAKRRTRMKRGDASVEASADEEDKSFFVGIVAPFFIASTKALAMLGKIIMSRRRVCRAFLNNGVNLECLTRSTKLNNKCIAALAQQVSSSFSAKTASSGTIHLTPTSCGKALSMHRVRLTLKKAPLHPVEGVNGLFISNGRGG